MLDPGKAAILFLGAVCLTSFFLHLWLIPRLNIVEDESAYMQDAAQITAHFLPFREFGGTKGPVWLFLFKGWQFIAGQTIFASRLFSSLAHVGSILIVWKLMMSFGQSKRAAGIAVVLWGLSAVAVSLSTNITHIPLELVCILGGFYLLRRQGASSIVLAALLLWAALLMRASAVAFAPAIAVLLWQRPDRVKAIGLFVAAGIVLVIGTVAVVYPLYGWPKTAFFFNLDATLIAGNQRAAYAPARPVSALTAFQEAAMPLFRDGLSVLVPAFLLPFLFVWRMYTKQEWPRGLIVLIVVWIGSFWAFYKAWGRTPTPFYPLESTPALALASALVIESFLAWSEKHRQGLVAGMVCALLFAADLTGSYREIPLQQYRGTVEVPAAKAVGEILTREVPLGEAIFTAQPIFPFLANLPLYGGYTHPGWYLSERAGIIPAEIRRVFLPDFDILVRSVARDVNWIVVDWRTADVYFNGGTPVTKEMRDLLEKNFELVAKVPNPASRDIMIYRRK